jgi:uncharacterized protein YgiM (DUF1202 family)
MGDMTVLQKQEIAKGAEAMGAIMGRYAKRRTEKVISPLGTLSIWGKVLAVVAAGVMIAGIGMMVFDASNVKIVHGKIAVVSSDTVNVRQSPSTNSVVVIRSRSGDRYNVIGTKNNWTRVRASDGSVSGWIATSLLETRNARTLNLQYEMRGYFTVSLIAMIVIFFALRMKKVPLQMPSRTKGSETLLVDTE